METVPQDSPFGQLLASTGRGDGMEMQVLSKLYQRPIVIIDATETTRSGKISGICFSADEKKEFAVDCDVDLRTQFHSRALFTLFEEGHCSVLVTGEEPAKAHHHVVEN